MKYIKKNSYINFTWLNILKLLGNNAYEKIIPEWIQDAPNEFIQEFINGCVNNKKLQFTTISYNLAYGLQRLYLKLGYICYINKKIIKQKEIYCIKEILQKENMINNYTWFPIFKINKKETKNTIVYNFEVENDNSYIVKNIIVKNCQPFSKAGLQKGFNDTRGNLFFNICNIVKYHNPKYLILENVRNLASHDDGNTWKVIQQNINELGYYTYSTPVILNVLHFNIPQNRERVIIMCKRKDLGELPLLPNIPKNQKYLLTKNINNFIKDNEKEINKKYIIEGKMKDVEIIWNAFIKILIENKINVPKYPIWTDWWDCKLSSDKEFYEKYTLWIDKNRKFYSDNKLILKNWLEKSRENKNWIGAVRKFEWQAGDLLQDDSMNNE